MKDWIEILDLDQHDRDWPRSETVLHDIVNNYDRQYHEAPAKLDHKDAGPAGAWVSELKAEGHKLYARFGQAADWFVSLLKDGQFKKRSVELYRDLRGKGPYLRAVAFLGAAIPEVRGIADIKFKADESDYVSIELRKTRTKPKERNQIMSTQHGLQHAQGYVASLEARRRTVPGQREELVKVFTAMTPDMQKLAYNTLREGPVVSTERPSRIESYCDSLEQHANIRPQDRAAITGAFEMLDGTQQERFYRALRAGRKRFTQGRYAALGDQAEVRARAKGIGFADAMIEVAAESQ